MRKLKQREIFKTAPGFAPFPDESNPVRKYQKTVAVVSRASIAEGTTALALKLYRSEKGHYPKTLNALVPDYLDRIPPCPFNGKPFEYQSDGKSFELGIVTPSPALREHYRISSKPEY